ncbi:MAG TPA: cbb3-type cytochrome c oxidase subunit I [Acidobacteriaceae bacterium]
MKHRTLGFAYLALSTAALLAGTTLSLLMRLHLAWPDWPLPLHGPILPEEYLGLVTLHGTLMLFFVLTIAPLWGFGSLILPAQIGSRRMAFPKLNSAAFWLLTASLLIVCASPFVPGGTAISGWTAYPPLSAVASAGPGQGLGMDLWLASIALFSLATCMAAVNMLTTIVCLRCDGMAWHRLPLTVWGWFTASLLSLPSFAVLLAALVLLFCDRHLHTGFFLPATLVVNGIVTHSPADGSPLLWLHLFWFFGHPEVYIAVLPGMGLVSMVLANFARRRVFAYRLMIAVMVLIGGIGILVWGHHMFVAGLSPFAGSAFAISSMAIAVPASAEVLSWIATVWGSRARLTTSMLFALGFVSLFITGGLTGPILAQPILDQYLHNTFFVVAHFHLIMAMAGVFGLYLATYYWFPLIASRTLNERLGKIHFWLTIFFAYSTFLPMHITGLAGEPRHYAQLTGIIGPSGTLLSSTMPLQRHITVSALCLALAQIPFFINLWITLRSPATSASNPWDATTMEWAPNAFSEDPAAPEPTTHVAPCEYSLDGETFHPQWQPVTQPNQPE